MGAGSSADVDAVVTAVGDLVVPSEVVRQLRLCQGSVCTSRSAQLVLGGTCMARWPAGCRT